MEVQSPQSFHEYAGTDIVWRFTVADDEGAAVDITGFTFQAWVKQDEDADEVLSSEDSPPSLVPAISDAANGVFTLTMADTDTAGLIASYIYQIQATDSGGGIARIAHGYVTFKESIS